MTSNRSRRRAAPTEAGVGREALVREVRVFDAEGKVLGRLATEMATSLRGKDRPTWVPYRDDGAVVIVTNTDRIRVTGEKEWKKFTYRHTQRKPGAQRRLLLADRLKADSRAVVREAVWNMLPKNRLRHRMITRLQLYRGEGPSPSF